MRITFPRLFEIRGATWENARDILVEELDRLKSHINVTWEVAHHADGSQKAEARGILLGQISGTLVEQPTGLSVENDGLLYFVTDYGHLVRWNGPLTKWEFAPGDSGNGFFQDFAITPQATGWSLCDGSTVAYLVVGGATLTTANITLPDLDATAAYRKSAGSYTGSIVAAGGSSGSTAPGLSGSTASNGAHTHAFSADTGDSDTTVEAMARNDAIYSVHVNAAASPPSPSHVHSVSGETTSDGAHTHSSGTLSVDSHTHGIGSLDPAHLNVLPYFRR